MDNQAFETAKEVVFGQERGQNGIGTLGEKTIHAVVKNYLEPDTQYQEVRVNGYVADICRDQHIYEIQTRNFNALRRKLESFLPTHQVTVVFPIPATKQLVWLDPETGEVTKPRKSPRRGSVYMIFKEMYRIKNFLSNPNLSFLILLIDVEETRLLNGWSQDKKKGSVRFDGIPDKIVDEMHVECVEDYQMFLPMELPEHFTTKDYSKVTKLPIGQARTAVHILNYLNCISSVGKQGNAIIYKVNDDEERIL